MRSGKDALWLRRLPKFVLLLSQVGLLRLSEPRFRFLRVHLLDLAARRLASLAGECGFRQSFYLHSSGELFVESGGVFLSSRGSDRYLKLSGKAMGNEGQEMVEQLSRFGISPVSTMVDIGANVGEVSLGFSAHAPGVRIVAVEPSPRNLALLRHNIGSQFFSAQIEIHQVAISSRAGQQWLADAGASSRLATSDATGVSGSWVKTMSLRELFRVAELGSVDFVKIDIEGSESLLVEDIKFMAARSKAWLIEHSLGTPAQNFMPLVDIFDSEGYRIFLRAEEGVHLSSEEAKGRIAEFGDRGGSGDYWFVQDAKNWDGA